MGLYILDPVAWDFLEAGQPLQMPDLLETMREAGRPVHCFKKPCYWLDIGRLDDYATANEVFDARRHSFLGDPSAEPLASDSHLRVDPGTPVEDHRPLGPHSRDKANPRIGLDR
jgi:NDP-sugar pyrophosphorylase family protein